jgi:hypothetical protein
MSEFFRTADGKLYADTTSDQGRAASDVAAKLLNSRGTIDQFGVAGMNKAKDIDDAQAELYRLAGMYTSGNMARLQAGDFESSLSDKDRAEAVRLRDAAMAKRTASLEWVYARQQAGGKAWTAEDAMAAYKVDRKTAETAVSMDASAIALAEQLNKPIDVSTEEGKATKERLTKELQAKLGKGQTIEDALAAVKGVYDPMRAEAERRTGQQRVSPEQTARAFMEQYGVNAGDSEADKAQLNAMGQLLKTEQGQALMAGLQSGLVTLDNVAKTGKIEGATTIDRVGKLEKEYRDAMGKKEGAERDAALKGFRSKYGLDKDEDFATFERAEKLQQMSGFDRFGTSAELGGGRTDMSLGRAEQMISRYVVEGKLGDGGGQVVKAVLSDDITVNVKGTLKTDGTVAAQGKPENAASKNAVATK